MKKNIPLMKEDKNWFARHPILTIFFGLTILGMIISAITDSSTTNSKKIEHLSLGDEGFLYANGIKDRVPIAISNEAVDELVNALMAEDMYGVAELYLNGKIFDVNQFTKAKIIDTSLSTTKVRILEGKSVGRSGWIPYEWIVKEIPQ